MLDALLVILPRNVEARVRDVPREAFTGLEATLNLLSDFRPHVVAEASLSYRGVTTDGERSNEASIEADEVTVATLKSKSPEADWNEGGIDKMAHRWVSTSTQGAAAAVAGYEQWPADVAHLGVVADPNFRRGGHTSKAAATATQAALSAASPLSGEAESATNPLRG